MLAAVSVCAVLLTGCRQSGPTLSASPSQESSQREASATSSPTYDRTQRPCEGEFPARSGEIVFACPSGWLVWQEAWGPGDILIAVVANRPVADDDSGTELSRGWVKVDVSRARNAGRYSGLKDLEQECLANPDDRVRRVVSCRRGEIGGKEWVRSESEGYGGLLELGIRTLSGDWVYTLWAGIGEDLVEPGRRDVEGLFESVRLV